MHVSIPKGPASHDASQRQTALASLKTQYKASLPLLSDIFPDWTTDDLAILLSELGGDVERAVHRISEGNASRWAECNKRPVVKREAHPPSTQRDGQRQSPYMTRAFAESSHVSQGQADGKSRQSRKASSETAPAKYIKKNALGHANGDHAPGESSSSVRVSKDAIDCSALEKNTLTPHELSSVATAPLSADAEIQPTAAADSGSVRPTATTSVDATAESHSSASTQPKRLHYSSKFGGKTQNGPTKIEGERLVESENVASGSSSTQMAKASPKQVKVSTQQHMQSSEEKARPSMAKVEEMAALCITSAEEAPCMSVYSKFAEMVKANHIVLMPLRLSSKVAPPVVVAPSPVVVMPPKANMRPGLTVSFSGSTIVTQPTVGRLASPAELEPVNHGLFSDRKVHFGKDQNTTVAVGRYPSASAGIASPSQRSDSDLPSSPTRAPIRRPAVNSQPIQRPAPGAYSAKEQSSPYTASPPGLSTIDQAPLVAGVNVDNDFGKNFNPSNGSRYNTFSYYSEEVETPSMPTGASAQQPFYSMPLRPHYQYQQQQGQQPAQPYQRGTEIGKGSNEHHSSHYQQHGVGGNPYQSSRNSQQYSQWPAYAGGASYSIPHVAQHPHHTATNAGPYYPSNVHYAQHTYPEAPYAGHQQQQYQPHPYHGQQHQHQYNSQTNSRFAPSAGAYSASTASAGASQSQHAPIHSAPYSSSGDNYYRSDDVSSSASEYSTHSGAAGLTPRSESSGHAKRQPYSGNSHAFVGGSKAM